MFPLHTRTTSTRRGLTIILTAVCLLILTAGASATAAEASRGHATRVMATASRAIPHSLSVSARRTTRADRRLVSAARRLKHCLSVNRHHPKRCKSARHAVQRAGSQLASAETKLAKIARRGGKNNTPPTGGNAGTATQQAPVLNVTGQKLSWARVAGVNSYVLVRKVPGQAEQFSVVNGTSITPPPVPGVTVSYSVRTSIDGSAWSNQQSIAYPATSTSNTQSAPALSVSGQKLTWQSVANVSTYVLATKVPGHAVQYTEVSGTSVTPAAVAGVTVSYSVRTAVDGSAWSPEVKISYPAAPVATPTPTQPAAVSSGPFEMGVVAGSAIEYELPYIQQLGAHTARMEFSINTPVSQMESIIGAYAQAGVRPLLLAGFEGRIPSTAEAQNLASWAAAFGPGGSFWQGKSYPASAAVTDIEFGNETSYSYQFADTSSASNWYALPSYAARAQNYALRFKDAVTAIQAVNPNVGLLAQADDGGSGTPTWVNNMFAAVPNLASLVAGWTVHPYGPQWEATINRLLASTAAKGASATIPIYATEFGISSDNGRCLQENFGFNKCMSYAEAASTLESSISAMRAKYGSRLRDVYLFQARDQQGTGGSTEREGYCGALQSNQATKGAYTTAVQSLLSNNP
ncbi:MAG TPA: hypothetical protein VGI24_02865 [Solirubrobacteraceae bacterium]|jgi:hypothetical protein